MQAVLSMGSTIAIRYAAVRRQGEKNQQILDYQTHQHALFPIVAFSYALRFMASDLIGSWTGVQMDFEKTGDEKAYMSQIQDYHAVAAGLKAILGWWTADSLEAIRRSTPSITSSHPYYMLL
jgi:acyl-CoA oxidase